MPRDENIADGNDELLLAVFRFKNRRPSDTQTAAFCWQLRDALGACVGEWSKREDGNDDDGDDNVEGHVARLTTALHLDPQSDDRQIPLDELTAKECAWLRRGWQQLLPAPAAAMPVGAVWTVEWFPAYAGVLQAEQVGIDTVALRVVALDHWEWTRHFLPAGECVHSAISTKHVVLACGSIEESSMGSFRAQLMAALAAAKLRTGTARRATNDEEGLGHQKTPQFLVAAVRTAIDTVSKAVVRTAHTPRGGMTDVGLHTGGAARDTCWPLVCAALRQSLPPSCALADKVLLKFTAVLLERELRQFEPDSECERTAVDIFWSHVDKCMEMLDTIGVAVVKLVEDGYDGAGWLAKCQLWRRTLDDAAARWNEASARAFRLPDLERRDENDPRQFPKLPPPHQVLFDALPHSRLTSAMESSSSIAQHFKFIDSGVCSPRELVQYIEALKPQDHAKVLVGLRAVETLLLKCASGLTSSSPDDARNTVQPAVLLRILTWYRGHQTKHAHWGESMRLQQVSMHVVVSWVAFCLAHQYCAKKFHEMAHYRIVLDWQRLDVCILRERSARHAILHVVQYIRDWNQRTSGPTVLDLSNFEGTLALARRLGKSMYEDTFAKVQEKWHSICQATWAVIVKRKEDLSTVRREISEYEAQVRMAKQSLAEAEAKILREWNAANPPTSDRWYYRGSPNLHTWETKNYRSQIRRLNNLISQKAGKRDRLRRMPEFLANPLPFDKSDALEVLCLIAPPKDIDVLAALCWRAQLSLNPSPSSTSCVAADPGGGTWRAHFEKYSGLAINEPAQYAIAYPGSLSVPSSFGPMWIDDVGSKEAFVSSSTWFPDVAKSSVHWRDESSNGRWANPFTANAETSREFFTPRMARASGDWQWAVEYPATGALQRGNATYAHWGQCVGGAVHDESTLEFCSRGTLRAYPTQQLRRVFACVEADSLEWSSATVRELARQALYQVGEIEGVRTPPILSWHRDLEVDASVRKFCAILNRLVGELDHSPRRWECIPLVSELASFLCQYDPAAKSLVKSLSRMAIRWAEDTRRLWQRDGVSDTERKELRTRECVLYGYAALCYDHSCVRLPKDEDVEAICMLVVHYHNAKLFVTGESDSGHAVDTIQLNIDRMMAHRIVHIVKVLTASPQRSQLLTRLCRCVDASTPEHLSWHRAAAYDDCHVSSCFTAQIDDETQYTVNLFSGAIETNGSLPSGLPASIRQMPLYRRLFDDLDFEVTRRVDVFTTTRNYGDSVKYRFRVEEQTSELLVEEHRPMVKLQLCDQAWCNQFAAVFPRRLTELYVHWCWIDQRVVFLRLPRVAEAQVRFVVVFGVDDTARCYEVARQDWGLSCDKLTSRVDQYPVMVVGDAKLLQVLSKFEAPQYVHMLRLPRPRASLEISLPRFGLQFQEDTCGRLVSVNHRGFVLSTQQQLHSGQVPRFRQYLLLESDNSGVKHRRLLIPTGQVTMCIGTSGLVKIAAPNDPSATLAYSAIDEHKRLGLFTPDTIEARLQLAAISAASGTLLPWRDLGMTGGEAALEILRGCTPSRPLSEQATQHLVSIATCFSYQAPVLTLLVALLLEKSRRLMFLFGIDQATTVQVTDALDEYRHRQSSSSAARLYPPRQCLSRSEEWDLLGSAGAFETTHARTYDMRGGAISDLSERDEAIADSSFVCTAQAEIASCCASRSGSWTSASCETTIAPAFPSDAVGEERMEDGSTEFQYTTTPAFPLSFPSPNAMAEQMIHELRVSWEAFHRHDPSAMLTLPTDEFVNRMRDLQSAAQLSRERCEANLRRMIAMARNSVSDHLLEAMGRHAQLNMKDIMRSVLDDTVVLQFAPRLPLLARDQWKRSCLWLLELCVWEDKLERMVASSGTRRVLEEFQTTDRCWNPAQHPYWLVFEVEGRLQIRQEQYVIAKHLIDNPGSICQLNMGRGKTRVILPMLFLYHSYKSRRTSKSSQVVRAHFLSPLLSETRDFMWRVLTSGVLQLPFLELPFNRSCFLGRQELRQMQHALSEAKRNGAVVMVAPEHRLSLELKHVEMRNLIEPGTTSTELRVLDNVLDPHQYVDIFDESDALLHHGYHLVYAVGASVALDGGSNRWLTAEALLRVLISAKSDRVQQLLRQSSNLWSYRPEYLERRDGDNGGGTFNGFQLSLSPSTSGSNVASEDTRTTLQVAIVEDLMDHAPFDLEWLRVFSTEPARRYALIALLTDPAVDADEMMKTMPSAILNVKQQVLALRGLLAFGVLENCLQKRYRVNYGHPPPGSRPKAIAIPYQAADLPSERSEFSHPDVGIVLTLLSFYHSGLSDQQIRRAFEVLLSLDPSEGDRYYGEWYNSIAHSIPNLRDRQMLENLTHISLDNAHQFGTLCATYRYAIEVVNFFLNFCVFPNDTRQFPSRLSRSAWDLVRGDNNVGFSGTNDTHALLPLAVTQREPDEPALRGTNGMMLQLLLDATRGYEVLATADPDASAEADGQLLPARACWQSLLLLAVEKQCDALIDTGALLAGVSNHDAALFVASLPGFAKQGVTYYDTRSSYDGWVVFVKARNLVHSHKTSSLRESDTFVIFDEARSRGSDMKLLPRAVALLTLGPTITKDKLMQGAGRMRQLGEHQQTLWLTSTRDVYASIARQKRDDDATAPASIRVVDILSWVVDNTQRQCTVGLLEWAHSGVQFHAKEVDAACELQADDWTLEGQYAGAQRAKLISEVVETKIVTKMELIASSRRPEGEPPSGRNTLAVSTAIHQIRQHATHFGSQDVVSVTSLGEECERELQIEEEQQEERESVRHDVDPCTEKVWDWSSLLSAASARDVVAARVQSLAEAATAWLQPRECRDIAWARTKIYGTANFWSTVKSRDHFLRSGSSHGAFVWTSYLRHIHGLLVFGDGSTLLLSELEEDAVLKMLHTERLSGHASGVRRGQFAFVQLPFVVGYLKRVEMTASTRLDIAVSSFPLALGWDRGHATVPEALTMPFTAVVACCLLNGDTDLLLDVHPVPAETVLRDLLGPLRHREENLHAFITLRGFTARWKRSSLHAIAKRLDLEDDVAAHT